MKLRRLFNQYDEDRNEKLDAKELNELMKEVLPSSTPSERSYFEAMVDISGKEAVGYETFFKVVPPPAPRCLEFPGRAPRAWRPGG